MCRCISVYRHIGMYEYVYICVCVHVYLCALALACSVCMHMRTCVSVCMHLRTCVSVYMHMRICALLLLLSPLPSHSSALSFSRTHTRSLTLYPHTYSCPHTRRQLPSVTKHTCFQSAHASTVVNMINTELITQSMRPSTLSTYIHAHEYMLPV